MSTDEAEKAPEGVKRGPVGPDTPEEDDSRRDRCLSDRESLSPRETADCAGEGIAELYENEEDGGS